MNFFYNLPNPSIRIMAVGFTQPLTEMSASRSFLGEARQARKDDTLTAISEPIA
jgi:hypothetical protein